MTQAISPELLATWNQYGQYVAYLLLVVGVVVFAIHYLKLLITKDYKERYDYINIHEINRLWLGSVFILIGLTVYVNTLRDRTTWLFFFIGIFLSVMIGMIIGVIIQNLLKFYYPFFIEKRLKHLRYSPRISPDGRQMKLLSEEEEDVYLDAGMQAEEEAFSVDYDVWMDEVSGYTKIEKYNGRLHALNCSECGYQTLRVDKEEVIQPATDSTEGELMKYFTCGYCGHKEKKSFKIAKTKQPV